MSLLNVILIVLIRDAKSISVQLICYLFRYQEFLSSTKYVLFLVQLMTYPQFSCITKTIVSLPEKEMELSP